MKVVNTLTLPGSNSRSVWMQERWRYGVLIIVLILRKRIWSGGLEHKKGVGSTLLFYAPVRIGLKPLTPFLRPCLQSPLITPWVGGDRECFPLRVCGFKCLDDPASWRDRRYNRYVLTIPCNIMIGSCCSSEAAIDTPSGEEKGNAAIEIVQK